MSVLLACALIAGCFEPAWRRDAGNVPFGDLSSLHRTGIEVRGFFQPEKLADRAGIYFVQPYQPGKIPVLFVHGFASTPATWAALFDDLQSDPELAARCQFWFYYYPTGNPFLVSAADLRERLTLLRERLDPEHRDAALDDMVVVGHSMGGLLAKLLTVDGGDDFWRLVCAQPLDSLHMKLETRSELQRLFFFHAVPGIRRVVFIATPHHGAQLSATPVAKLAAAFVQRPQNLIDAAHDLAEQNPRAEFRIAPDNLPTSLTLLWPGDPALELLAARPRPGGVHGHSVIGVAPLTSAGVERLLAVVSPLARTDGVVPYASAHVAGVDSECVVPADHGRIQLHPKMLLEIRRILREHLSEAGNLGSP
jgi:pimeloyl-ACP methyl ester carboxylesterase